MQQPQPFCTDDLVAVQSSQSGWPVAHGFTSEPEEFGPPARFGRARYDGFVHATVQPLRAQRSSTLAGSPRCCARWARSAHGVSVPSGYVRRCGSSRVSTQIARSRVLGWAIQVRPGRWPPAEEWIPVAQPARRRRVAASAEGHFLRLEETMRGVYSRSSQRNGSRRSREGNALGLLGGELAGPARAATGSVAFPRRWPSELSGDRPPVWQLRRQPEPHRREPDQLLVLRLSSLPGISWGFSHEPARHPRRS